MKNIVFLIALAFSSVVNAAGGKVINPKTGANFLWSVGDQTLLVGSDGKGKSWVVITRDSGLVDGLSADNHYWTYDSITNTFTDHGIVEYTGK